MGLLDKVLGKSPDIQQEIADKGFEVSSCSFECDSCHTSFPSSVKVDDGNLWNSSNSFGLHIVVPTNKTDWSHDALSESKSFGQRVNKFIGHSSFKNLPNSNIKVTVSSQSTAGFDDYDPDCINGDKGDMLILPQFVWIRNIHKNQLDSKLQTAMQMIIDGTAVDDIIKKLNPEFLIQEDMNQSYLFLCSHRARDKRCGITAPIMKKEIDIYTRELGFYRDYGDNRPEGIQVAFINHVGGHKYSANVIIYLKHQKKNIWLARCSPINVKSIIDECVLKGKVFPEHTRLIQNFAKDW